MLQLAASFSGFTYYNTEYSFWFQHSEGHCIYRVQREDFKCLWYHNIMWFHYDTGILTKINTRCFFLHAHTHTHRLTQSSRDKHRPWTVTAPPYRFMWLSNHHLTISLFSMEAAFRQGNQGRLDPKSNLYSRNGRYSGKEYRDCLSTCCNIFKTSQHYTHVTRVHRSLTTRQYSQSLIKCAFDRTLRDKGRQPLGREGTTLLSLYHGMYMSSYLHVNPEVNQRGSRRSAL